MERTSWNGRKWNARLKYEWVFSFCRAAIASTDEQARQRSAPMRPSVIHRQGRAWWGNNLLRRISSAAYCGAHYRVRGACLCIAECGSICDAVLVTQAEQCDNRGDKERRRDSHWMNSDASTEEIYNSHVGYALVRAQHSLMNSSRNFRRGFFHYVWYVFG